MATFPIEIAALLEQGADPAPGVLTGKLYSKSAGGITQLFYETDAGVVYQLTPPQSGATNWTAGNGSPEGAVVGSVGDMWSQLDAVGGPVLWIKRTGAATNTGWSALVGMVGELVGGNTGILFLGMSSTGAVPTGKLHGSNAGMQYSADVSNRAQLRTNQYGANVGAPGMTTFKSRGAFGLPASVIANDILGRWTAIGISADNASLNLAAFLTIYASGAPTATKVPCRLETELTNLAGTREVASLLTSEGEFSSKGPIGPGDGTATGTATGPRWRTGFGSPEAAVVGSPGDLYSNVNGIPPVLYVKETGVATNTGWVGK